MMVFSNGVFSKPQNLKGDINSVEFDAHECISADESFMIYDSTRPGGFDQTDCFVSAKFGPLMIFLKRWFAYDKITLSINPNHKKIQFRRMK